TRPLLDKLGVKPGQRIALIGRFDGDFAEQLRARGASVARRRIRDADQVFLAAHKTADLARIAALKADLRKDGALWVVRPKGTKAITESETQEAGLDAGLVDVKVVSFSPTHTAEKFVFRLKDR
ncbi:MAG: hypothetical protein ACXVQV_12870, partial [Actinomycetota bacterium]